MHSSASADGQFNPPELIRQAVEHGVYTMAVSDHDTVRNVQEALIYAEKNSVKVIPAAEFSCNWGEYDIHILGYGIEVADLRFEYLKQELDEKMHVRCLKMIEKVKALGIRLNEKQIWKAEVNGVIAPERIGESALKISANKNHPLLQPFFPGGSRADNPVLNFAWDVCEKGGPAYVPIKYSQPEDIVELIHSTGGVAVLAHPGCCFEKNINTAEKFVNQFCLDGIEVYSSYHDEEATKLYKRLANEKKLLLTAGSDFHGKTKPNLTPGCVGCEGQEKEIVASLLEAIKSK